MNNRVRLDSHPEEIFQTGQSNDELLVFYCLTFDGQVSIVVHVFDLPGQYLETRIHRMGLAGSEVTGDKIVSLFQAFIGQLPKWRHGHIEVFPFSDEVAGRRFGLVQKNNSYILLPVGLNVDANTGHCTMTLTHFSRSSKRQ
jgi:hypothetical protein